MWHTLCTQSLHDASWTTTLQGNKAAPYQITWFYIALLEYNKATTIRVHIPSLRAYKLLADMQKNNDASVEKGYLVK